MNNIQVLIRNHQMKCENIEDTLIVYDDNNIYILHEIKKNILQCFDGNKTIENIGNILKDQYDGYNEIDYQDFVRQLIEKNILILE